MLTLNQPLTLRNSKSGHSHRVRVVLPARPHPVTEQILTVRFSRTENHPASRHPGDLRRATLTA